jgi:hypothetical protein
VQRVPILPSAGQRRARLNDTLPEGGDMDAIAQQFGAGMRDGKVITIDIEQERGY